MPDDDFFIRRYARFRDAGDMDAAREVWKQAVERKADFVEGMIRGFKFPDASHGLKEQDRGEALTIALWSILKLGESFRGSTGAEFRAVIKRIVFTSCIDIGRIEMKHEKRSGGSFDDRYEDSDGGRFDKLVEQYLEDRKVESEEAEEADLASQQAIAFVHWAISQVANDDYRAVLELTFIEKLSGEQIAERVNTSLDNVYQRRRRGLKELEKILRANRP